MKIFSARRLFKMLRGFALPLAVGVSAAASAAGATNVDSDGLAIQGYDPVAYFTEHKAVKGSAQFAAVSANATYWFASAENQQAFKSDPQKYTPQYGGYCAYGVAHGYKPKIDPTAFSIVEGKLYLNYSASVQGKWEKDIPAWIGKADEKWKTLEAQ